MNDRMKARQVAAKELASWGRRTFILARPGVNGFGTAIGVQWGCSGIGAGLT